MRKVIGLVVLVALSGCSAQGAANFVSGMQTACADETTGTKIVTAADPNAAGSSALQKVGAACAAIQALPQGSFAPVLSKPNS